jgi:Tat protein translocase TatC
MNDRPTSDSPTEAPQAPQAPEAPIASNGASNLRLPTGPPPGTAARGTLDAAPTESTGDLNGDGLDGEHSNGEHSNGEHSNGEHSNDAAVEEVEVAEDDEWVLLETEDGRPMESPYDDEARLAAALTSADLRTSGAYDYPLDEDGGPDFQSEEFGRVADAEHEAALHDLELGEQEVLDSEAAELDAELDAVPQSEMMGAAPPPIAPGATGTSGAGDDNVPHNDREMGLMDHLGELRVRLLWCVASIAIAMIGTWNFAPAIQRASIRPAKSELDKLSVKSEIITVTPTEGFMLQFNVSLVSALILVAPFVLFQAWRFIEPAMTGRERRFTGIMVPFSSVLFFAGCGLGYAMSPLFFRFFASFVPPETVANWSFASTAEILVKMLLVCGVTFQVPVVTIFLNKAGLVQRDLLIQYWRHVVVVIFVVVAILTPTWDPVSLIVCACRRAVCTDSRSGSSNGCETSAFLAASTCVRASTCRFALPSSTCRARWRPGASTGRATSTCSPRGRPLFWADGITRADELEAYEKRASTRSWCACSGSPRPTARSKPPTWSRSAASPRPQPRAA